jgi:CRISPR-associated endonuclease/helicase Cas3
MEGAPFYARAVVGASGQTRLQGLTEHSTNVARLAASFAAAFGSAEWGHLAGLWHDLGKCRPEFQARLRGEATRVEHSGIGAAMACRRDARLGLPLAFTVSGHHSGLPNLQTGEEGLTALCDRVSRSAPFLDQLQPVLPTELTTGALPGLPPFLVLQTSTRREATAMRCSMEFWTRFLYSCLVDADALDAEAFTDPDITAKRGVFVSTAELRQRLDDYIERKVAALSDEARGSPVNRARAEVLEQCRRASGEPPGVFSLTVPTGGGKTLSAMAFALRHAQVHGMARVIVVIPYTSIIEQNAGEYRAALGAENVIEHHSNLDPERLSEEYGPDVERRTDLASENWDAPVIVTTSVQFFESLFANRRSRCRKLHNVAQSVIVLDEVQTLPPGFVLSILDALNELVANYGCSVVLSTATPPALAKRGRWDFGLRDVRPIIADPVGLAARLQRVEYVWPASRDQPCDWPQMARALASHERVLAVVHRRDDARLLAQEIDRLVPSEGVLHLSALMCPAHRLAVLDGVRKRLRDGRPCRVVSTQLVEAGVDLDFPVVFRALGGLDSVVQAAGRCNREGLLTRGRVTVFRAPTQPPLGTPRRAAQITESLLQQYGNALDAGNPALFDEYFRALYFAEDLDANRVQPARAELKFATVADRFQLIEDGFTRTVIVPYGDARQRLEVLRRDGPQRDALRRLQPFTVSIYPKSFESLWTSGALAEVAPGVFALVDAFAQLYDLRFGLVVGDEPAPDPRALVT